MEMDPKNNPMGIWLEPKMEESARRENSVMNKEVSRTKENSDMTGNLTNKTELPQERKRTKILAMKSQ